MSAMVPDFIPADLDPGELTICDNCGSTREWPTGYATDERCDSCHAGRRRFANGPERIPGRSPLAPPPCDCAGHWLIPGHLRHARGGRPSLGARRELPPFPPVPRGQRTAMVSRRCDRTSPGRLSNACRGGDGHRCPKQRDPGHWCECPHHEPGPEPAPEMSVPRTLPSPPPRPRDPDEDERDRERERWWDR